MTELPAVPASLRDDGVRRKVLGLVGLGVRGRLAVVGAERVREQARKGSLQLALVAVDGSRHTLDKFVPLLRARQIMMVSWPEGAELASVVGRETTAAIGIVDQALARGIRAAIDGTSDRTPRGRTESTRDAQKRGRTG